MIANKIFQINQNIAKICKIYHRDISDIKIVAVSKTIASENIITAIENNCQIFGENYVAEALQKWPALKLKYPNIRLHFIGHLQSNKAKDVVELFDCIESVDSEKLAKEIAKQLQKINKKIDIFIQVNIGSEPQKSGVEISQLPALIKHCQSLPELNLIGLMAIPPAHENPSPYFALLSKLAKDYNLKNLSMGMSADYESAIALGANYIRLGTAIFGERK